ncbi:MAG: glycosyltransferase family 9 protein [Gemmatimonadetes bacterium]|nr:glycosyltransferase family 9 protein [Gemmatimonadota bacterium]NNK63541.1 glycosyltransferase family 9 protein [Gemmatimonadota bacterium]
MSERPRWQTLFPEGPPRRICIVMLSAIGDAVHVLPVANALKRHWPECRITWVIQPVPHRLVADHPAIDDFLLFHRRRGVDAWEGFRDLSRQYPQQPYDLVLGLQVYFKAGVLTGLAPARVKLGFDRHRARDMNWLFTNERVTYHGQRHVQDQYFEFLEHLGLDPHPAEWGIPISDEERRSQAAFFGNLDRPACAVVVGTSKERKNWTPEGYARVLEALEDEFGMQPVLVGGPSAVERRIADEALSLTRARSVIDTLGNDLRKVVWLLDGSALAISPDTGPLHIARALETPVVGLYGYTNPKRTGPWRRYQDLVVDGYAAFEGEAYPVSPEYRDGMTRVTVDAVVEKIGLALERYPNG